MKLEDARHYGAEGHETDAQSAFMPVLEWGKALRMIEEPSADQAKILAAFGYEVALGILQKIKS